MRRFAVWVWGGAIAVVLFFVAFAMRRRPKPDDRVPTEPIRGRARERERTAVDEADANLKEANAEIAEVVNEGNTDDRNDALSDLLNRR